MVNFDENSWHTLDTENEWHIFNDIVPVQDILSCNIFDDMFDLQVLLINFRWNVFDQFHVFTFRHFSLFDFRRFLTANITVGDARPI